MTATLDGAPLRHPGHRHDASSSGSSACGVCGKDSIAEALGVAAAGSLGGCAARARRRTPLPGLLREHQTVFDRTGGVHAAGPGDGRRRRCSWCARTWAGTTPSTR